MFSSWTNAKNKELASVFASSFELDVILDFLKENKAYFKYRHSFILLFPLQLLSACWQRFWSPGEGTSANDNLSASGSQEQQRSGWCGGALPPSYCWAAWLGAVWAIVAGAVPWSPTWDCNLGQNRKKQLSAVCRSCPQGLFCRAASGALDTPNAIFIKDSHNSQ